MLKILSDGDERYRVEDSAGIPIGWISGRTIGFRGFVTEDDARRATVAARHAFDKALAQQFTGWPCREPKLDELRTMRDGAYEVFHDANGAVARLLRPHRRAHDSSFGIELALPTYAPEGVAITTAHSVGTAVEPYRDLPAAATRRMA